MIWECSATELGLCRDGPARTKRDITCNILSIQLIVDSTIIHKVNTMSMLKSALLQSPIEGTFRNEELNGSIGISIAAQNTVIT